MEEILSIKEIRKIHEASLEILSEVGIKITHPEIRKLLLEAGVREGNDSVLFFPRSLVEESARKAPRSVFLADLRGNKVEVKPGSAPLFWGANAMYYFHGSQRTEITRELYVEFCRVSNQLSRLHAMVGTSLADYPPASRDFVGFRAMAENTQKHLRPVIFTPKGVEIIIEMADILLEGKPLRENPIVSFGFTSVSPLQWSDSALEVFRVSSGYGIPLMINSEVISGATAPVTLAGSLVLANAEALSGVTIAELLEPGRPLIFNLGISHVFDMKFGETLNGSPEGGLLGGAGGAIARFHGLPSASWMGTESKIPDAQATYEKTLTGLLHALGGANIIWGIGNLESTLTISPEQAVIDDEIAAGILRAWKGIKVDEEHLALSVIKAMKQKADYLSGDHTFRHFRQELLMTELLSRERFAVWVKGGKKGLLERARDRVATLRNTAPPDYLSSSQREKLQHIEKHWLERQC